MVTENGNSKMVHIDDNLLPSPCMQIAGWYFKLKCLEPIFGHGKTSTPYQIPVLLIRGNYNKREKNIGVLDKSEFPFREFNIRHCINSLNKSFS